MKSRMLILFAALCAAVEVWAIDIANDAKHVVLRGDTTYSLAKKAGMDADLFQSFNSQAYNYGGKLLAGATVWMRHPFERGSVTPAKDSDGRYSIHEYEFHGAGNTGHSYLDLKWRVMWPEEQCGLNAGGLENFRSNLIDHVFWTGTVVAPHEVRYPMTIDEVESCFQKEAHRCMGDPSADYWCFGSDCTLTWPFGMGEAGEEWYERPVICYKSIGHGAVVNMGGHLHVSAGVFSLPDGRKLDERDYFREDAMDALFSLVWERLFKDNGLKLEEAFPQTKDEAEFGPGRLQMIVSRKGVTWWVNPYHVFPGIYNYRGVTIPWSDLYPFLREPNEKTQKGAMQ